MSWESRYVGIPFCDAGFDFSGCNCWGLVHLVLKNEAGVIVPTYAEVTAAEAASANLLFQTESVIGPWVPVAGTPKTFDVVLMRGSPMHAGIITPENKLLHVWRATHAMLMPLTHPRIRFRQCGTYRHKDLA